MEDAKIFVRFLRLAQKNFNDEREIDFYTVRLGITPDDLTRIIWETSESCFPEWLEIMQKVEECNSIVQSLSEKNVLSSVEF